MTARTRLRRWGLLYKQSRKRRRLVLLCAFHDLYTGRDWTPESLAWSRDVHVDGHTRYEKLQKRHQQVVALIDERSAKTEFADLYSLLEEEVRLVAAFTHVAARTCDVRQNKSIQELVAEIKRVPHTDMLRKQHLRQRIREVAKTAACEQRGRRHGRGGRSRRMSEEVRNWRAEA